jgi:hypothetical protein
MFNFYSVNVSIQVDTVYTNITPDVIGDIQIKRGFTDSAPSTRVAAPGSCVFMLRNGSNAINGEGTYSKDSVNHLAEFKRGAHIVVDIPITQTDYSTGRKFEGWVESIEVDNKYKRVTVNCYDWLYYGGLKRLPYVTTALNKDAYYAVDYIKDNLIPDGGTVHPYGNFTTFQTIFDIADDTKTAIKEINQLVSSELGYFYIGREKENNTNHWYYAQDANALILEAKDYRATDYTTTEIVIPAEFSDLFTTEDDEDSLITEDDYNLVVLDYEEAALEDSFTDVKAKEGELIYNKVNGSIIGRRYVDIYTPIWKLDVTNQTYRLNPYEQIAITASYYNTDFDAGDSPERVYSADVLTPVATTDYTANTAADGSGSDMTAELDVSIAKALTYSKLYLHNSSGIYPIYITFFRIRGKPIYISAGSGVIAEDTDSQDEFGLKEINLDLPYMGDVIQAYDYLTQFITFYKENRFVPTEVTFYPNKNQHLALLFWGLDVGSQIRVIDSINGIDNILIIDFVDMTISPGNVIKVTWRLREKQYFI